MSSGGDVPGMTTTPPGIQQLEQFQGNSSAIIWLRKHLQQFAQSDIPILIYGETGTGKTMLADIIHALSQRSRKPYVHLDCGAMVEDLVANELFGHMRGSFTSADRTQSGLVEQANGGTLFLDELGNLSFEAQTKLLQVLDQRRFRRVGGIEEIQVDVRIIGASSQSLREAIHQGRFRKDLFYRLKGITLHLPPLRQRREDILLLFMHYLSLYSHQFDRKVPRVTHEARTVLLNYPWPGNVRELQRLAEEIAALHQVEYVTPADLKYLGLESLRCWEIKHCNLSDCPAYGKEDNRCWLIENTIGVDGIPRSVSEKIHYCLHCEVFIRNCVLLSGTPDAFRSDFLSEQIHRWMFTSNGESCETPKYRIEESSYKEFRDRALHCATRRYFAKLLSRHHGDLDSVCKHSGLSRSMVYQILREHQINIEPFRKVLDTHLEI